MAEMPCLSALRFISSECSTAKSTVHTLLEAEVRYLEGDEI